VASVIFRGARRSTRAAGKRAGRRALLPAGADRRGASHLGGASTHRGSFAHPAIGAARRGSRSCPLGSPIGHRPYLDPSMPTIQSGSVLRDARPLSWRTRTSSVRLTIQQTNSAIVPKMTITPNNSPTLTLRIPILPLSPTNGLVFIKFPASWRGALTTVMLSSSFGHPQSDPSQLA
jgi:hypothetical protein